MTRSSAIKIFWSCVVFLMAFVAALTWFLHATSIRGKHRSIAELNGIFDKELTSFEQLVAFCGDQPSIRSVYRNELSANTYIGVTKDEVEAAGKRSKAILEKIDAYRFICSWDFDQSLPRFYSLDVGFYFNENKQGVQRQDISYYASNNLPDEDELVSDDGSITLTKLPIQGWYIWEQGINHETAAP